MRFFNRFANKTPLIANPVVSRIAFGTLVISGLINLALPNGANAQNTRCPAEISASSTQGSVATEILFRNISSSGNVKIYWLNYQGQRVEYNTLAPYQSYVQSTYLTHPWVATDSLGNCLGVVYYPDSQRRIIEVALPNN